MIEATAMAKDQMFKLRLDEQDRKRLDDLATHLSASAATVVRMLIKKEHDQIKRERLRQFMTTELFDRAVAIYYKHNDENADMPSSALSGFTDPKDPDVLVLANTRGTLARLRYNQFLDRFYWLMPKDG